MILKELALEIPALRDEAKQLWGVDYPELGDEEAYPQFRGYKPHWQYHLEQLLKSDDPEQYLRENT